MLGVIRYFNNKGESLIEQMAYRQLNGLMDIKNIGKMEITSEAINRGFDYIEPNSVRISL